MKRVPLELDSATTNRPSLDLESRAFRFQRMRPGTRVTMLLRGGEEGRAGDKPSTCFEGPGPSHPHRGPRVYGSVGGFNPANLCHKINAFLNYT